MSPKLKKPKGSPVLKADKPVEPDWDKECVILTLKYIQYKEECFSDWQKKELAKFWDFNKKLHEMTWRQIFDTASKGKDKRGMAYTIVPRNKYKKVDFIKNLSSDIKMFELRVDQEIRVHGFREKQFFHLCILDRKHAICPE